MARNDIYLQQDINIFLSLQLENVIRSSQNNFEFKLNNRANNVKEFIDLCSLDLR